MTPEEIRETLFRILDKLYGDRTNAEELLRSERVAHNRVIDNLNAKMAAKDRMLAEKEARIATLEKELAQSKAANVDSNHNVESANQEKFCGTSKKGIDKKHTSFFKAVCSGRTDYENLIPVTINLNA